MYKKLMYYMKLLLMIAVVSFILTFAFLGFLYLSMYDMIFNQEILFIYLLTLFTLILIFIVFISEKNKQDKPVKNKVNMYEVDKKIIRLQYQIYNQIHDKERNHCICYCESMCYKPNDIVILKQVIGNQLTGLEMQKKVRNVYYEDGLKQGYYILQF